MNMSAHNTPPTEKAQTYQSYLYIYLAVYAIVVLFKLVVTLSFNELFCILFLYLGASQINFCYLSTFLLFSVFSFLPALNYVLTIF